MEEQIPPSQPPMPQPSVPQITPDMLAEMKARARELAVQQTFAQQPMPAFVQPQLQQQPQVIYVKRNLTVAEILLVVLLSCGIVTGVQWAWSAATGILSRVEIKMN